jgi:hypothetical protein
MFSLDQWPSTFPKIVPSFLGQCVGPIQTLNNQHGAELYGMPQRRSGPKRPLKNEHYHFVWCKNSANSADTHRKTASCAIRCTQGPREVLAHWARTVLSFCNGSSARRDGRSKSTYRLESARPSPAAWNTLQYGHCASQGCQSAGAFPLDKGFESFTHQRCCLRYPSKFLSDAYEIVIQHNGYSHEYSKLIIASGMSVVCLPQCRVSGLSFSAT